MATKQASETRPLIQTTFDNGLQVLVQESRVAPVASFWIFYRVGSRNEPPGLTGISHWVEHMLFKGTERYPQGEFDKAVARAGGLFNGMTWLDFTTYFETFPTERIGLALEVESDRMVHAVFDPEETESERTVILSEREGSENNYPWRLRTELQAAAFQAHPYGHPVIGWREDLLAMTRDDLYRHYRTYYTPNNAVAVAVGDFDGEAMVAQIQAHFGALPPGPAVPPVRAQEPAQRAERRILLRGTDPTGYLQMAFHVPGARHPDFFPLVVLDSVLGGAKGMGLFGGSPSNRSHRLYRALVDRELAAGVHSAYYPTLDAFLFSFQVTLHPKATHQQVEDVIWAELEKIQQEGVTQAELRKAIQQTKAQFAYSSESVTNRAYWLGFSAVVADTDWFFHWLERLGAVTSEDVQRVARQYFQRQAQTVGWYLPDTH